MKNPFARLTSIFNRAAGYVSMRLHVAAANLWRDSYNPLRGLTIARAVSMLENGERGAYAELQWTYRFIEMQDATIGALVERRTSAIQQLDWSIKIRTDIPEAKKAVAEKQQAALEAAYGRIENLSAALEFLEMAAFRGFSHLEKVEDAAGNIVRFEPVDQWFLVRDGMYGAWKLNPNSTFGTIQGEDMPPERFIVREVARPINRVAMIAFIRKNLSQKDWDAFIETYGVPAVFIIMPENVPTGREDEYLDLADQVASDARGTLPGGSDVKTVNPGVAGEVPFKSHLDYQDAQIVMRGTGGLLTMLTQSGSGTLAGNAHADTFAAIARAEAAEISEILRTQFDREILAKATPGEPAWAYFELAANEETDTKSITEDVARLAAAGFEVSAEWIAEKTGYEIKNQEARDKSQDGKEGLKNRGGRRTLDDGRKVFIRELDHPTDKDKDQTGIDSDLPEGARGIRKAVEDYKAMRKTGNVADANRLRDQIKSDIEKFSLNAAEIWGEDPDAKTWQEKHGLDPTGIKWERNPGNEVQAPFIYGEGYQIVERGPNDFNAQMHYEGRHEPLGRFESMDEAKKAVAKHKEIEASSNLGALVVTKHPIFPDSEEGQFGKGQMRQIFRVHPAGRGVKDKLVLTTKYADGIKSDFAGSGQRLADALGARYSHAQRGFVMTRAQYSKWKELIQKDYDAVGITREIYHLAGDKAPPLSFKLRIKNREDEPEPDAVTEWLGALRDDLQPLGKALEGAMLAGDEEAVRAALKKLSARMPEFVETPGLEAWMAREMAAAIGGGNQDSKTQDSRDETEA